MAKTVYALLIGIDKYASKNIPTLHGCKNDIAAISQWLEGRVKSKAFKLKPRVLLDKEATYANIVKGFQEHLGKAGKDDIVLVYYSGHGSQENADPIFWPGEPDQLNETLVCYDSRLDGTYDLADKELAVLLEGLSQQAAHVLVILDCCHSGSGTRAIDEDGTRVRRAPVDARPARPWKKYLFGNQKQVPKTALRKSESNWYSPRGHHVLLAACASHETAKEVTDRKGKDRGAFSAALLRALESYGSGLNYRGLINQVKNEIAQQVLEQTPQLEASQSGQQSEQPFLGGAVTATKPYFTLNQNREGQWVIDGGAVHGLPEPKKGETTHLAIYPADSNPEDWQDLKKSLGRAKVTRVNPTHSLVKVTFQKSPSKTKQSYKAVVVGLPLAPMGVLVQGETKYLKPIRELLKPSKDSSIYVREVKNKKDATLEVSAKDGAYRISRIGSERSLVIDVPVKEANAARTVVARLEHIARWQLCYDLKNPTTQLGAAVKLEIFRAGKKKPVATTDDLRFEYRQVNGKWQPSSFKVKLTNTSKQTLYCALLDLSETYQVHTKLLPGGIERLEPNQWVWAFRGDPIEAFFDLEGVTEFRDYLKLLVSTEVFDPELLEQPPLDVTFKKTRDITGAPVNTLQRLLGRVQTRTLGSSNSQREMNADWTTHQITITTVRPLKTTPVPKGKKKAPLGSGVSLLGHSSFSAKASLISAPRAGRDVSDFAMPALMGEQFRPLLFKASRGLESALSVLELSEVKKPEAVTKEKPLVVETDTSLREGEYVLASAYDARAKLYLPLGVGAPSKAGVQVRLERLPEPMTIRSLTSAIRIWFYKFVSDKLDIPKEYPLMRVVEVDAKGKASFAPVQNHLAKARRILLFVHGIVGDTPSMVKGYSKLKLLLKQPYDVVLAFDYENLNTPIEETAQALKEKLIQLGFQSGHDKTLHVAAHSMGGLVSRYMIEKLDGKDLVQKLVVLGTPSGGSPWPSIVDLANTALALGLNSLSAMPWAAGVVGWLLRLVGTGSGVVKQGVVTDDQMKPSSELLKLLKTMADPELPYYALAGDQALQTKEVKEAVKKILATLKVKLISKAFMDQANDIAVSVNSVHTFPNAWASNVQQKVVACDHFSYFSTDAGLKALSVALSQEEGQ